MFGKPDLTILLTASPQTRMKRISDRDPNDPDLNKPTMKEYGYDKMIKFLDKYNFNYVIVDTETLSLSETIEKCKNLVKSRRI